VCVIAGVCRELAYGHYYIGLTSVLSYQTRRMDMTTAGQGVKISVNSTVDLSANMRNWTYMNVFYSTAFAYLQSSFFIEAAGNGIVDEE